MLVIAFDLLHNNFKITTTPFFHLANKNLEKIKLIIISIEVVNLVKQTTGITRDLAIILKKKRL